METTTTPKRKYQKHKEGFKIAVVYKLNTKLKPIVAIEGDNTYPLYVEVRAKNQYSFYKSRLKAFINPNGLEEFLDNSIVQKMLSLEKDDITESIRRSVESGNFNMSDWYKSYREDIDNESLMTAYYKMNLSKVSEALQKHGVREEVTISFLETYYYELRQGTIIMPALINLLNDLNIKGIAPLIEINESFESLYMSAQISFHEIFNENLDFDFSSILDFFTLKHVKNLSFRKMMLELLEAGGVQKDDPSNEFVNLIERFLLS